MKLDRDVDPGHRVARHSRAGGNPGSIALDSRLRGNDTDAPNTEIISGLFLRMDPNLREHRRFLESSGDWASVGWFAAKCWFAGKKLVATTIGFESFISALGVDGSARLGKSID